MEEAGSCVFFFPLSLRKQEVRGSKEEEEGELSSFSLLSFSQTHPPASTTSAGARRRLSAERAAQRLLRTSPVVEGEAVIFLLSFRFYFYRKTKRKKGK